ncbi:hypothetical protein M6D93_16515 [Jatrophihabitans telluris]|uniref:Uncharacterized protein n=1 Tax=Jatrophihabitans telluris TaxID=2038343 RepID=A0ABY4QY30_9ACTN|nr:hypothetical protein [Jatrophihabitans telluris]UQX87891.1 hypothetical protein M6D93_16515 [Jatrophihabitans telluris]
MGRLLVMAAACGGCVSLFGGLPLPLPIAGMASLSPLTAALFLPLVMSVALAWALDRASTDADRRASRSLPIGEVLLTVAVAMVFTATALCGLLGSQPDVAGAIRNGLGGVGCVLLSRRIGPPDLAAIPVIAWSLLAAIFGRASSGARPWAWPVAASDRIDSWCLAVVLAVVGTWITVRQPR